MKKSASAVDEDANNLSADGPGDFGFLRKRWREECETVAHGRKFKLRCAGWSLSCQRHCRGIEIELGPFGALERPFVLGARHEFVDMAHLQLHFRLLRPALFFSVQEVIEESQLLLATVVSVEVGPVLDTVRFKPFVLGGGPSEAFEIPARMQALTAPVRGGE